MLGKMSRLHSTTAKSLLEILTEVMLRGIVERVSLSVQIHTYQGKM